MRGALEIRADRSSCGDLNGRRHDMPKAPMVLVDIGGSPCTARTAATREEGRRSSSLFVASLGSP
eukprot:12384088-Heterocapsa_arctica.AAC.1